MHRYIVAPDWVASPETHAAALAALGLCLRDLGIGYRPAFSWIVAEAEADSLLRHMRAQRPDDFPIIERPHSVEGVSTPGVGRLYIRAGRPLSSTLRSVAHESYHLAHMERERGDIDQHERNAVAYSERMAMRHGWL